MIKSRYPEGGLSKHTIPSNHGVLDSDSKSMADMKATSDIGRGKGNNELSFRFDFAIGTKLWFEEALLFPPVVPSRFDSQRIVARGR